MSISIAIAGTTNNTVLCAKALANNKHFHITFVITPIPKKIGRKKELTKNLVHKWSQDNNIQTFLIKRKLKEIKHILNMTNKPDYLLVVDFGYYIPNWLIKLPTKETLNIHPSKLPKYRGSSPGQMAILFNENQSAISLIRVSKKMDQGDIFYQKKFPINPNWTQQNYYQYCFNEISKELPQIILKINQKKIKAKPQPNKSPTLLAKRLSKIDGFIPWKELIKVNPKLPNVDNNKKKESGLLNKIITTSTSNQNKINYIKQAIKAFYPWPGVWTFAPTKKGLKRMKILSCKVKDNKLYLKKIQIAGMKPVYWNEIKNTLF